MNHTHFEQAPGGAHPMLQFILYGFAGYFAWLSTITADEFRTWVFWGLSILSIALTISLNIKKHREMSRKDKEDDEDRRNK